MSVTEIVSPGIADDAPEKYADAAKAEDGYIESKSVNIIIDESSFLIFIMIP